MKRAVLILFTLAWFILLLGAPFNNGLRAQDCTSSFYQIKENASVTLQLYDPDNNPVDKKVLTYKKVRSEGSAIRAHLRVEYYFDNSSSPEEATYEISCQNGITKLNVNYLLYGVLDGPGVSAEIEEDAIRTEHTIVIGDEREDPSKIEISSDAVEIPSRLSPGQTLKGGSVQTKTTTMGSNKAGSSSTVQVYKVQDQKVEGIETIETSAGKFKAYKVSYRMMSYGMAPEGLEMYKAVTWYAKGPGEVKSMYYFQGKLIGYSLLTAYNK
jgi:hypothetical protein